MFQVLAVGLLCNVLRFLYISLITWPWLVLPFEFVQGNVFFFLLPNFYFFPQEWIICSTF